MANIIKILVVDDEPDLVDIIADDLETLGPAMIVKAFDGMEAYRKARNQGFDLICTDYKMPKLTGAALVAALRDQPLNEKTPVIVISGYIEEAKTQLKEQGLIDQIEVISKPYNAENLLNICKQLLQNKPDTITKPQSKSSAPFKLDVEFINPFIAATVQTLSTMCETQDIKVAKTFVLKSGEACLADISGNLSIQAKQFSGTICVSFPSSTFLTCVSRMLGEPHSEITAEIEDAAGELTNIIYGKAKTVPSEKNWEMEKALPNIMKDKQHSIKGPEGTTSIVTQFSSKDGDFFVTISIKIPK